MIPDEAVEAAVEAHCEGTMLAALEAAYPILLSHEREQTRLAHIDAVVNARTVDRLERELAEAKADAWDEGYQGCYGRYMYEPVPVNPYRSQA